MLRIINMNDMHHCIFWVVLAFEMVLLIILLHSVAKIIVFCCFELVWYGTVVV